MQLSEEHVSPKWLRPHVPTNSGGSGTHTRSIDRSSLADIDGEHRSYAGPAATQVVRSVGIECNNGLATLTGETKPAEIGARYV